MATFREFVHICTIYILLNQVSNQYAFSLFNFGQALLRRKAPPRGHYSHSNRDVQDIETIQGNPSNLLIPHHNARPYPAGDKFQINQDVRPEYDPAGRIRQHGDLNPSKRVHRPANSVRHKERHIHIFQQPDIKIPTEAPHHERSPQYDEDDEIQVNRNELKSGYGLAGKINNVPVNPANQFVPNHEFQPDHREGFDDNFIARREPIGHGIYRPLMPKPEHGNVIHKRENGIRMQHRTGFGGQRQTYQHFRYSRIRRYYTLSTASMTTWKRINYTVRLMYTSPTRPTTTTVRYTTPYLGAGSSRQTVLHTRMTESDEIGRDRFMSGSIEYKDDSFDKPPTEMVAYDSLQMEQVKNATLSQTETAVPVTTPVETTSKKSIELISLESSSEQKKSSSSEAKEEDSSSESESAIDKLYGEYGHYRKYNNTPNPFTIITYANLREVPGFEEENLTSAEVAFWQANASYVMENYLSSDLHVISNYSEENLVKSFFYPENIEPHHLDFYKWYYKLLTNPERLRVIYNRTVLEEPDYKNLSQFTPYAVPEELQRYYMFINQMEREISRERKEEEYLMKNQREAEQNIDKILGDEAGQPDRVLAQAARRSKKDDPNISQILQMVDNQQSDSLMREDDDSPERFIDANRFKRDVSRFEPD